ncbi:male sterility protein-domain-containing protein [Apiospora phragmitis]|uniref:Male sterility protein-domain-containing protein n=1 Tax=Apiospora phragmitis TaxID=2905665 RepID=A0ABR1WWA4_9PEZI
MESQDLNYFTCTLGQAALWKKKQSTQQPIEYSTVLELIDSQGQDIPDAPAIGFANFSDDGERGSGESEEASASLHQPSSQHVPSPRQVTFRELKEHSLMAATVLGACLGHSRTHEAKGTVGLMCASSLDFVFTWLGLMRLGYTPFLLAPQLEEKAISHLCSTTGAAAVFVDRRYRDKVEGLRETLRILDIPSYDISSPNSSDDVSQYAATTSPKTSDVAYLRHTSGTSSGLPKPIYQTHWGAVGILPRLPPTDSQRPATFSTTPLYHGGLADCFRAWAAGAMIWCFPEGVAPVTGANIVKAVECAGRRQFATGDQETSSSVAEAATVVGYYFTSVPYVLQMLSESDEGIRLLQSMDPVGVGGAALPAAVGDKLVSQDVNLVSRMGSAECGFLLSSDRDYAQDKEWQFLRAPADKNDALLAFEPRGDDGLSELVALPDWPLLAKTNRPDGSYATADLFEPHPSLPGAWRYHSRSDTQITLANGKKFDPSPLEGAILAAASTHLRDILVFGGGRDYPGALLFPRGGHVTSESEVVEAVWPVIQKLNKDSQSHARLSKAMLVAVVMAGTEEGEEKSLPKSSKGTIMRRQAEDRHGDLIEKSYKGVSGGLGESSHYVSNDDDVPSAIAGTFAQVLGQDLDPSQDLYGQGVDSIACIQIRKAIECNLLPDGSGPLPINIIYDCATINELVDHVLHVRWQQQSPSPDEHGGKERRDRHHQERQQDADMALMRDLVQQNVSSFSDLTFRRPLANKSSSGIIVILTGATGALGAHIVHHLLQDPNIRRIYCLLRAQTPSASHERVSKALSKRGLTSLEAWDEAHWHEGRVVCLPSELDRPDFGLAPRFLDRLRTQQAVIVHSAWAVNFSLRIGSFGQHFAATRNLIRLAAESGSRFYFVSSTAAVINNASSSSSSGSSSIAEQISTDPADATPLGYARSKWRVKRGRVDDDQDQLTTAPPPPISIIRVGQLFANHLGIWNASEAYPLMLSTARLTGCLPDLGDAPLNWLPVELAAQAVIEIAIGGRHESTASSQPSGSDGDDGIPVYHVLNPHHRPTWREMLDIISSSGSCAEQQQQQQQQQKQQSAASFETVPPSVWVKKLEANLDSGMSGRSSQGLLDLWKGKYSEDQQPKESGGSAGSTSDDAKATTTNKSGPVFELSRTGAVSNTIRHIKPLDKARILQMWNWLQESSGLCS